MKDEYVVHFWCVQQLWSMLCMSMLARKTRKTQQYKITIARNTLITKKLWQQEDDEDAVVVVAADDDDDAIIDYQQMCFVMVSSHVVLSRLGTIILDNFSLALFSFFIVLGIIILIMKIIVMNHCCVSNFSSLKSLEKYYQTIILELISLQLYMNTYNIPRLL